MSTLPFLAGIVLAALSSSLWQVLLSRCLAGLGDGIMYPNIMGELANLVPVILTIYACHILCYTLFVLSVYIAEIASKELRGSLTNVVNITQCLGLVLTFSLSLVVTWRGLAWLLAAPMLLTVLGMWTLPETPYWLAEKNRLEAALQSLAWLRDGEETEEEVRELREKSSSEGSHSITEKIAAKLRVARSQSFWRPFALAMPLNILYSCSGTSMFTFYMVTIFEQSGSSLDKLHAALIVSSWRLLLSCLSSVALLKLPRRPLFLSTTLLVALALAALGAVSYTLARPAYADYTGLLRWAPLVLVLLIFVGIQLGFNPIIKVRTCENVILGDTTVSGPPAS